MQIVTYYVESRFVRTIIIATQTGNMSTGPLCRKAEQPGECCHSKAGQLNFYRISMYKLQR